MDVAVDGIGSNEAAPAGRQLDGAAQRLLSALYRDNIERLRAYLARILKSEADADDVAQEAFLRLCRCEDLGAFNHPRAVLFKTGYRLALNRLRQRRGNPIDKAEPVIEDARCTVTVTAEEAIIARERESAYGQALAVLSPRCRQVIELRTVEELSYKEMSDTLGLSVSTLEKHLARGKRECTAVLAEWWQADLSRGYTRLGTPAIAVAA